MRHEAGGTARVIWVKKVYENEITKYKKWVFDAGQLKLRQATAAVRVGSLFCSNQITAGGPVPALASEVRRTGHGWAEQPFKWVTHRKLLR